VLPLCVVSFINQIGVTSAAVMLMWPGMERQKSVLISFPGPLYSFGLDYTGMSYLRRRLEELCLWGLRLCALPHK